MNYISIRREQLEPGALVQGVSNSPEPNVTEIRIQASIAISLKRIADLLEVEELESNEVITLPQILMRIAKAVEKPTVTFTAGHGISLEESLSNSIANLANTLAEHRMYSR